MPQNDQDQKEDRSLLLPTLTSLALLGMGRLICGAYRRDIRAARERISRVGRVAETSCGSVEYATRGEGMPLLIVHGAGGGFDQGLYFSEPLAMAGFRTIAVSRFGYLGTPLPSDASVQAQVDAHAGLLDALGIHQAVVIGASAGAPSSLQFALRYPERCLALVLVVPAAYVPRGQGAPSMKTPAWTQLLFETALRSDFLFWTASLMARPIAIRGILATPSHLVENASEADQARVDEILRLILPVTARRAGLLNDVAVISSLQRYELERITVPTLVISTEDDMFGTFEPARYTAEHIPGARFIGYATGGHVWIGHQEDMVSEIVSFLRSMNG